MSKKFLKNLKFGIAAILDVLLRVTTSLLGVTKENVLKQPLSENDKVLFVSLDHLGDAVMATPAIEAFKTTFPTFRLTILIRPQNAAVFAHNPYVDEVLTDDAPWWSENPIRESLRPRYLFSLHKKIKRLRREGYKAIIDLRGDLRHLLLFGAAAQPRMLLGYDRTGGASLLTAHVPYDPKMHEIDKKLALLAPLGVSGLRPNPMIKVLPKELVEIRSRIRKWLGDERPPLVLLDPGGKPVQRWPAERWAHIVQRISHVYEKPVLLSAGPTYRNIAEELVRLAGPQAIRLAGELSVRQLIALVAVCDLVISSDTGVAHIASALHVPAVTLFGPTDPGRFWHGVDTRGIVRSPDGCCRSELHGLCLKQGNPISGFCMLSISENMVETAVLQILNSIKKPLNQHTGNFSQREAS